MEKELRIIRGSRIYRYMMCTVLLLVAGMCYCYYIDVREHISQAVIICSSYKEP